jgi:hypothetical protein
VSSRGLWPKAEALKTSKIKSLFASFASEKEDSSFFEKKKQKNFIP